MSTYVKKTNLLPKRIKGKFGKGYNSCRNCKNKRGLVRKYNIFLCIKCSRENLNEIGFVRQ